MTKEDIEKIVEKTVEWLNGYAFTDDDKSAHIPTLIHDFLKDSRVYFDNLVQPSLPSDLDEAAEEYLKQYNESESGNGGDDWEDDILITFKAGAEWMAGQGYTKEETVYFERLCDENRIMVDLGWGEPERGGFNPGDKVVVQIRKK